MDTSMDSFSSLTMRDHLRVLFHQKDIVITSVATIMVVAFFGLLMQTPVYEAKVKMLISGEKQLQSPYYKELMGEHNVEESVTQSEIVVSDPVLTRVVQALELDKRPADYEMKYASSFKKALLGIQASFKKSHKSGTSLAEQENTAFHRIIEGLKKSIKVAPIRDTNMFTIGVRDIDPTQAAAIANVVSRSYIIFDLEQQLAEVTLKYGDRHPSVLQLRDNIDRMTEHLKVDALTNIEAIGPASVKIIEQASTPLKPTGQSRSLMLLLGIFLSVLVGITLAFVFEYTDPTFKSMGEIEAELRLPILGSVPRRKKGDPKLVNPLDKDANSVHFYQVLCDEFYLLIKDKKLKSILLAASGGKEGASTMIASLAVFLSERAGYDVLLIDANFRHPSLHQIFSLDNVVGFSDIIQGRTSLKDGAKEVGKGLHVLTSGETELNPAILLDSSKAKDVMRDAFEQYQIVLVDGPNLVHYRDSITLATHTDATVVVVSEGQTRRQVVKAALQPLVDRKTNILGIIVNNRTFPIPRFLYERM